MDTIALFADSVRGAYDRNDGFVFADLFQFDPNNSGVQTLLCALATQDPNHVQSTIDSAFRQSHPILRPFVMAYFEFLQQLKDARPNDQFDHFVKFYRKLKSSLETPVQIPLLNSVSRLLISSAQQIDRNEKLHGEKRKLEVVYSEIAQVYRALSIYAVQAMNNAKNIEESICLDALHIINLCYEVSYKLQKPLAFEMTVIKGATWHTGDMLKSFPLVDQTTYRFHHGRCALWKNEFQKAKDRLNGLFKSCPAQNAKTKRCILKYLIPARIMRGEFPTMKLLQEYNLVEPFADLVRRIKTGNIAAYRANIEKYIEYYSKTGTYMLFRTVGEILVWRSLIYQVYAFHGKPRNLSFSSCLSAVQFSCKDQDYDIQDVASLLTSLVGQVCTLNANFTILNPVL